MKNKFCSNKANSNKISYNSQYESTKDLFELASEYEANFLSVNYEHVSPKINEDPIAIAKEFLSNITASVDSVSDSSESEKNFGFLGNESTTYESFNRSYYGSQKRSLDTRRNVLGCDNFKRSFSDLSFGELTISRLPEL